MAIDKDMLDQLLAGRDPKQVCGNDGPADELKKTLSERIPNAEIDEHLETEKAEGKTNHRNGYSRKSMLTATLKVTLAVPCDRAGTCDPRLIAKYQRRLPDFDGKIIWMQAREITVREIRTNSIETSNSKLPRAVRLRGHFPNDDAATKLMTGFASAIATVVSPSLNPSHGPGETPSAGVMEA